MIMRVLPKLGTVDASSETETIALNELLLKHSDTFSKYKGGIGSCTLIEHCIHTGNNPQSNEHPEACPLLNGKLRHLRLKRC